MSRVQLGSKMSATIGVAAAVSLLAACQSTAQATKVGSDSQTQAQTQAQAPAAQQSTSAAQSSSKAFKVGDQVKNGSWIVAVHKAEVPFAPKNEFDKPKDGDMYVVLDVEVKNTDSKPQDFSSMIGFELKDSANHVYDETILVEDGMAAVPEGTLAAGEAKRGEVAFEIPKDAKGLTLMFRGGLLDSQAAVSLGK